MVIRRKSTGEIPASGLRRKWMKHDPEYARAYQRLDPSPPAAPPALTPPQIVSLRRKSRLDRSAFARSMGVGEGTIKRWESGATKPRGTALKLLATVRKYGVQILG